MPCDCSKIVPALRGKEVVFACMVLITQPFWNSGQFSDLVCWFHGFGNLPIVQGPPGYDYTGASAVPVCVYPRRDVAERTLR